MRTREIGVGMRLHIRS